MKKQKFLLIFIIIIVVFSTGLTLSGYVYNKVWEYGIKSKSFYFTSDQLSGETLTNVDTFWDKNKVYFNIKNYQNIDLITRSDIEYEVKCSIINVSSSDATCTINGTDKNKITSSLNSLQYCQNNTNDGIEVEEYNKINCDINGYDWIIEPNKKDQYFEIELLNEEVEYLEVLIEVESIKPYKTSLKGEFKLSVDDPEEEGIKLNLIEDSYKQTLNIINSYNTDKCLTLSWNEFRVDYAKNEITSYDVDELNNINSLTFSIPPKSSISLDFYTTIKIKTEDFSLNENMTCS